MRLLLDTNQVLRICQMTDRISVQTRELLWAPETALFVSAAAFWEISLKTRIRHASGGSKLPLKSPPAEMLAYLASKGVAALAIEPRHTFVELVMPPYTNDPFDHLMLQQAQAEDLKVLTSDRGLHGHPLVVEA